MKFPFSNSGGCDMEPNSQSEGRGTSWIEFEPHGLSLSPMGRCIDTRMLGEDC